MQESFASLFGDFGHAVYSGIRPQPGVDIEFRLERFHGSSRLVRAKLVRSENAGAKFDFVTGGSFEMTTLGSDYERLETTGAELASIVSFTEQVSVAIESDGGVLMRMVVSGEALLFKIYAHSHDREFFQCWDWFVDPSIPSPVYDHPTHAARPVAEVARALQAAA